MAGPLKRKLTAAEETLARVTKALSEIDEKLADPELYVKDPKQIAELGRKREQAKAKVDEAEAAWMAAAEALEAVS